MTTSKEHTLSKEEEEFVLANCKKNPNISYLAKELSGGKYDGRSKLGKAIAKFLVDRNIDYKTTKYKKLDSIKFNQDQINFITDKARKGMNSLEIATLIFPNKNIKPLCFEQKEIVRVVRELGIDSNEIFDKKYSAPKSMGKVIQKINKYVNVSLEENKLSPKYKKSIENLLNSMNSPRFVYMMNSYETIEDREIFESNLVKSVWDQHDITADESNLYLNLSADYVMLKDLERHRKKLTRLFDEAEEKEHSVKMAEMLKAKSGEYASCADRIEKLINKLNGSRAQRKQKQLQSNESILSLVEAFQDEEDRKNILKQAKIYEREKQDEVQRLETIDEFKARLWGIDTSLI